MPGLADVLAAQQPASGYPQRWPLPFPVEDFLVREGELGAWVAEVEDAAIGTQRLAGHVSVTGAGDGVEADGWSLGTGRPLAELAAVSVLFVDHTLAGRGIGTALLDAAVAFIRASGRAPVLDVVQESADAVAFYRARGWQVIGEARPWWLPDDLLPVLLMTLPDTSPAGRGVTAR
nr:GNAT family N-acetyltransferase [Knoellia sp. DB2414S]